MVYPDSAIVGDDNQSFILRPAAAVDRALVPVDAVDQLARASIDVDGRSCCIGAAVGVQFVLIAVYGYLSNTVSRRDSSQLSRSRTAPLNGAPTSTWFSSSSSGSKTDVYSCVFR